MDIYQGFREKIMAEILDQAMAVSISLMPWSATVAARSMRVNRSFLLRLPAFIDVKHFWLQIF
jgi:hypothetical protein